MTAPRRPGEAKEEAPKKGGQTKDRETRVGKAKKAPRLPDKATNVPPGASEPHGKSKVKGRRTSPGRCVKEVRRVCGRPLDVRWHGGASSRWGGDFLI